MNQLFAVSIQGGTGLIKEEDLDSVRSNQSPSNGDSLPLAAAKLSSLLSNLPQEEDEWRATGE